MRERTVVAIASGKGGTGKTTVATNLAAVAAASGRKVQLLDCDVEAPNAHLFLKPEIERSEAVGVPVPEVDEEKCTACGECGRICQYSAIVSLKTKPLVFPELCHGCGGCSLVCPEGAIAERQREVGVVEEGRAGGVAFAGGELRIGEAMSPPLIRAVKERAQADGLVIIDAPPGTSCPVIEAVCGADFVLLVTEPTPFGLNDLAIAVDTVRQLGLPFAVVVNRAGLGHDTVYSYCEDEEIEILAEFPDDRRVVENEPAADAPSGVEGEHGLSLLVEVDGVRVLFDAGTSSLAARNAEILGLEGALARLNAVVLSHGHYDHTGGLAEVLGRARRGTPVFVRPGLFAPKAKAGPEDLADIGVPVTRGELEQLGGVVVEESGPREILPGFFVSGEIALAQELEAAEAHLLAENVGGEMVRDAFPEEQALVMKTERGLIVLIGCAHRGLLNSVAAARKACGGSRVQAILGGAHLRSASPEVIDRTAEAVARLKPDLVALGHCTGKAAEASFGKVLGRTFRPLRSGSSSTLE